MERITYQITDPLGIHARPAGLLVKQVGKMKSKVTIEKNGQKADAKRILALMGLGAKQGDIITFTFEGEDEKEAAIMVEQFLKENL